MYITASKLYDYTQCPHRIWRDKYGSQDEKIKETNPFVQLLWDRGVLHEENVIKEIGDFLDISDGSLDERFKKTLEAMKSGQKLIYQGVLKYENLLGIPDLLRRMPDESYIPVEIKSGMSLEGADEDAGEEGKPKKHYAIQLCLYVELLKKLGFENKNIGRVIDIHFNEVDYNLNNPIGVRNKITFWEFYEDTKSQVGSLLNDRVQNKPALAGICKLCPWYNSCKKWVKDSQDLSGIFYLGRSKRDIINDDLKIYKISDFAELKVAETMAIKETNKDYLKGVGEKTLTKLVQRAKVLTEIKKPVIYEKIEFPQKSYELFFDIEDDPTQEFIYLHGVYERHEGKERFIDFTAENNTREAEKEAWSRFWDYIRSLPKDDFVAYYYSHHEKTTYKKMQKQYPDVVSEEEVDDFFNEEKSIDLYKIVSKYTDWPLASYSLKDLAMYLGFKWRDETPSGALSIQWYNNYLETKDKKVLERILLYNEDDCKATMILKDAIENLSN